MSYHYFSRFEQGKIKELLTQGYSHRAIAVKLHRNHSSIDREIKRNGMSGIIVVRKQRLHIMNVVSAQSQRGNSQQSEQKRLKRNYSLLGHQNKLHTP